MTGNAYQRHAMRTNDEMSTARLELSIDMNSKYDMGGIVMATMGLSGEVGELNDMIKKWIFHKSDMNITHAKKELGDILWYVACMAESFGWSLDEIMKMNIDKLKARYPEGFDIDRANHKEKYDV